MTQPRQISHGPLPSEAPYFESQGFACEERYLVFGRREPSGYHLWRADLRDGGLAPLAPEHPLPGHAFAVHPDDRHAWFVSGQALWRVDVAGGPVERIWQPPSDQPGRLLHSPLLFTRDGGRLALASAEEATGEPIPDSPTGCRRRPTWLLFVDARQGSLIRGIRVADGFSHPMINPVHGDLASLVPHGNLCWNMELPQERRVRTALADARNGTVRPLLTPLRHRTITHESWSPDGERLWFFDKNAGEWLPVSICSIARDGGDWRCHHTSYRFRLGHGRLSADGRFFLSDCQERGNSALIRIDARSGDWRIVCWPEASNEGGHEALAHVHPSISPSGRLAAFTSDRSGVAQVYVVGLEEA